MIFCTHVEHSPITNNLHKVHSYPTDGRISLYPSLSPASIHAHVYTHDGGGGDDGDDDVDDDDGDDDDDDDDEHDDEDDEEDDTNNCKKKKCFCCNCYCSYCSRYREREGVRGWGRRG